jgi:hypothetical protein
LLVQEVIREYAPRALFAVEDYGASPMGERHKIDKYPAVFVDDEVFARPEDFYGWGAPASGRYTPWSAQINRERFKDDLRVMIAKRLATR